MEGAKGPRLRGFLSGSLATWALGLAGLVGEAEESAGGTEEEEEEEEEEGALCTEKRFLRLIDGALLLRVLGIIAPSSRGGLRMVRGRDGPAACRMWNLCHLWGRLRDFYQEELQLLILSPPPDLQTMGCDPFSGAASYPPSVLCPCPMSLFNPLWLVPSRRGSGRAGKHPSAVAGGLSAV